MGKPKKALAIAEPEYIKVREAAELLGCSVRTIYRLRDTRELGSFTVGRSVKVDRADVLAYKAEQTQRRLVLTSDQKRRARKPLVTRTTVRRKRSA